MAPHSPSPAVKPVVKRCPYCEKVHRLETRTCPTTGKLIADPTLGKTILGMAAPPRLAMPPGFPKPAVTTSDFQPKTSPAAPPAAQPAASPAKPAAPPPPAQPVAPLPAAKPAAAAPPAKPASPPAPVPPAWLSAASLPAAAPTAVPSASVPPVGATAHSPAYPGFFAEDGQKGRTVLMHGPVVVQSLAPAAEEAPAPLPVPQPSVVATREAPAAVVRVRRDAPITPFAAPLPPEEASVRPPAHKPPEAAPARSLAPVATLDEGDTEVNPLPVDLPAAPAPVADNLRPPQPDAGILPSRGGMALRQLPWLARVGADAMAALRLLAATSGLYLRAWRPLLLLVAILLLPVTAVKSCMVAVVMGSAVPSPLVEGSATTVDFSRAKQELARRIQASRAQGKIDKAATAELAALEAVSAASAVGAETAVEMPSGAAVAARWLAAALLTGLLVFGLAVPLAYATLTVALLAQSAGAPLPSFMDVGVLLWRRRLRFITALLPAAVLVGVGSALFLLPGLVAAVLLLFVPVVVLFERASGKAALLRSMALVRMEAVRVIVIMLAATVLGAAFFGLADLAIPEGSRRIMVFLRVFLADLLLIVSLPVPALAVARLYVDLRGREGVDAAALARAARR